MKKTLWLMVLSVTTLSLLTGVPESPAARTAPSEQAEQVMEPGAADHVILFVLEGLHREAITQASMPVVTRLVNEGAVTWSAETMATPRPLPAMASLLTGLPVEKHGITWETFEFSRGYPRPPMVFDYLDLSGGRDSAIFFMDEALYQLARPEPYTDYQVCGVLKPDCTGARLVSYIRQYFAKAVSGHGYGHAIQALPHFLVVHLPEAGRAGTAHGWRSKEYRKGLHSVDQAIGSVLEMFQHHGLLERTTVMITSLSGVAEPETTKGTDVPRVPWIASGAGIKAGHLIRRPVSILDTSATVMRALGLTTHTEWESRAIEEIFRDRADGPLVSLNRRGIP